MVSQIVVKFIRPQLNEIIASCCGSTNVGFEVGGHRGRAVKCDLHMSFKSTNASLSRKMTARICSAANDKATKKIAGASKFQLFCNQHTSAFPSFYEPRFRIFDHSVRSDDPHVLPKV